MGRDGVMRRQGMQWRLKIKDPRWESIDEVNRSNNCFGPKLRRNPSFKQ